MLLALQYVEIWLIGLPGMHSLVQLQGEADFGVIHFSLYPDFQGFAQFLQTDALL